jgi:hypothetical protein
MGEVAVVNHSPPSSAGVKAEWSYTSTPLHALTFRRRNFLLNFSTPVFKM